VREKMTEKTLNSYEKIDEFMRKKIKAQDASYTAIFQFNEGLISYAECQQIVFNCWQEVTGLIFKLFLKK
jgi:hypothetical protein